MNPAAGYLGPAVRKIRLFGVPATDEPDVPVEPVYEDVEIRMGAAESQELTGESGGANGWVKHAVDGNVNTYWHSNWQNNNVNMENDANNSFFLALKNPSSVDKVTYLPRNNKESGANGTILECEKIGRASCRERVSAVV